MPRKISEQATRKEMIDPQLEQVGRYLRDHSRVKTKIPVDGYDAEPWTWNGSQASNARCPPGRSTAHTVRHQNSVSHRFNFRSYRSGDFV
jgi:hypothetical protein